MMGSLTVEHILVLYNKISIIIKLNQQNRGHIMSTNTTLATIKNITHSETLTTSTTTLRPLEAISGPSVGVVGQSHFVKRLSEPEPSKNTSNSETLTTRNTRQLKAMSSISPTRRDRPDVGTLISAPIKNVHNTHLSPEKKLLAAIKNINNSEPLTPSTPSTPSTSSTSSTTLRPLETMPSSSAGVAGQPDVGTPVFEPRLKSRQVRFTESLPRYESKNFQVKYEKSLSKLRKVSSKKDKRHEHKTIQAHFKESKKTIRKSKIDYFMQNFKIPGPGSTLYSKPSSS